MTLTKTFPTDRAAGLPLADTRLLVAAMVESDTTGKPRAGVLPSHYNPLVTGTAGMAYSVAAFSAVTARAGMGAELVANDGAATVATTAAPGANSRIDVIWVRSLFTTTGDAGTDPVFGVTQGTAAASPSKPAIPAGALELATAVVLSTTTQTSTAVITQTFPYTAAEGGRVPVRNATERDAWTPANGASVFQIDSGVFYDRVGGAWVARDTGDVVLTLNSGWSNSSGTPAATCRVRNGMVTMNGRLDAGAGAGLVAFTLPVGSRPSQQRVANVLMGNTVKTVIIGTDGVMSFFDLNLPASDYRLASIAPFPAAS